MALPHEIAKQQARRDEYNRLMPAFDYSSPLNFLMSVFKNEDVALHTRLRAAAEACKYSTPQLRAVAHVTDKGSMALLLEKARQRADGARVLQLVPKAIEHSPAELKPTNGFKRRF